MPRDRCQWRRPSDGRRDRAGRRACPEWLSRRTNAETDTVRNANPYTFADVDTVACAHRDYDANPVANGLALAIADVIAEFDADDDRHATSIGVTNSSTKLDPEAINDRHSNRERDGNAKQYCLAVRDSDADGESHDDRHSAPGGVVDSSTKLDSDCVADRDRDSEPDSDAQPYCLSVRNADVDGNSNRFRDADTDRGRRPIAHPEHRAKRYPDLGRGLPRQASRCVGSPLPDGAQYGGRRHALADYQPLEFGHCHTLCVRGSSARAIGWSRDEVVYCRVLRIPPADVLVAMGGFCRARSVRFRPM